MKILVCDKTESDAIEKMRQAGLTVDTNFEITPEDLPRVLPGYDGCVVRSRTKIRQPLIDVCPNLKVIVRGGVGLDTIDADYARSKGITVMNTPKASSASVAELAIGFMFSLARNLYKAYRHRKSRKMGEESLRRRRDRRQDPWLHRDREYRKGSCQESQCARDDRHRL